MGVIVPPIGGTVYLDANSIIYSAETHPTYWPLLEPLWNVAQAGKLRFVTSELSILEVLVAPLEKGDAAMVQTYEIMFASFELLLLPIEQAILRTAAGLRSARKGLRTPDSIHAATAPTYLPSLFVTNDSDFRKIQGLPVVVLKDLLTP